MPSDSFSASNRSATRLAGTQFEQGQFARCGCAGRSRVGHLDRRARLGMEHCGVRMLVAPQRPRAR